MMMVCALVYRRSGFVCEIMGIVMNEWSMIFQFRHFCGNRLYANIAMKKSKILFLYIAPVFSYRS